ncbi:hypothetical protein [Rhodanobacter ginsengiterrae]|uniref:hypothetical protein n=1 Tax=Rhodanobacter ginsengiterrae TaxID=2008451 RepID=UPI003CE8AA29
MSILDSIFDGLPGYEKLMLICGFILFVFALAAITVMIVQRRDLKMVMVDSLRAQPTAPTDPQQQSAQKLNPDIKINAAVLHVARMGGTARPTER